MSDPRKFRTFCALFAFVALLLAGCNQPAVDTATPTGDNLGTMVAATMTSVSQATLQVSSPTSLPASATPTQQPSPTGTATPQGPVSNLHGKICFPGEMIPEMTAYFQEVDTGEVIELQIEAGQSSYETNLPPGSYQATVWLTDFSRGGLYSKAVTCGLTANCNDHSPITFDIEENAMVEGVDLCDWYGGPFAVPLPPGKDKSEITGTISGRISNPGGNDQELRIFFFNVNTREWGYYRIDPGTNLYRLPDLAPGTYHIVAYDANGRAGGHADANHNLIPVTVKAGEEITGIDISDWDAPAGAFPADPTK